MLNDLINSYVAKHGFDCYTELRAQKNTNKKVVLLNGSMTANASASVGGVNARIYKNGSYGFASSPDYTPERIKDVVESARRNAMFLDEKQKLGKPEFFTIDPFNVPLNRTKDDEVSQKTIIAFTSELDAYLAKKYPDLAARTVIFNGLNMEKLLYTSDGGVSHSMIPRSIIYVFITMNNANGTPVEALEIFGGFGTFDEVFKKPEDLFARIDTLYTNLREKCEGIYPEGGIKDCILHPDLAGILAHEAVGHTVEADFVQTGSVGGPYLNKRVASDLVTLIDFANTAMGQRCPVPVWVDDEGVPAEDAVLIENGILKGYMHNRESAMKFGMKDCGNARAYLFSDEPLIRMRNTAILPGKSKLEDMISSIDDGYYFIKTGNGQADATGEFMFGVNFGYEIKHGKLGRALRDTTISGVAFEMLKTVDMLSDDMAWSCSGMCGKKQPIPVGMGGPAIKCKINVGGR